MQRVPCRAAIDECMDRLLPIVEAGEVIAYPTETYYALGVLGLNSRARGQLLQLKDRNSRKPLPLVAADIDQAFSLFEFRSPVALRLATAFWPGPLTLVGEASARYRSVLGATVGVRVSSEPVAREIPRRLGEPITATSANRSGEPPIADPGRLLASGLDIALLVDGGPTPGGLPSTVVGFTENGQLSILRAGPVPRPEVDRVAGVRSVDCTSAQS